MADNAEISEDVRTMITQRIDSVVQLELLLLLQSHADNSWTPEEVARELRIDSTASHEQLNQLVARGLVSKVDTATGSYKYQPSSAALDATVAKLAAEYAARRVTVISLIYSKPADTLRSFSDAFRLFRREDKNG
jgi:predicted ArsR family transcriptional regulator